MNPLKHTLAFLTAAIVSTSALATGGVVSDGRTSMSMEALIAELRAMPDEIRNLVFNDKKQFLEYLKTTLTDERVAEVARKSGMLDSPKVRAQIQRATRGVLVQEFMHNEMSQMAKAIPDLTELARERYEAALDKYKVPEAIRIQHILLRTDRCACAESEKKKLAEELLAQVKSGADFSELAKKHSEDRGSAERGGELGQPAKRGTLVAPFEQAAFALKPGEVSDIVKTVFGYHIIKLIEQYPARTRPFEEVKKEIMDSLANDLKAEHQNAFLAKYRDAGEVVMSDETLEKAREAFSNQPAR